MHRLRNLLGSLPASGNHAGGEAGRYFGSRRLHGVRRLCEELPCCCDPGRCRGRLRIRAHQWMAEGTMPPWSRRRMLLLKYFTNFISLLISSYPCWQQKYSWDTACCDNLVIKPFSIVALRPVWTQFLWMMKGTPCFWYCFIIKTANSSGHEMNCPLTSKVNMDRCHLNYPIIYIEFKKLNSWPI